MPATTKGSTPTRSSRRSRSASAPAFLYLIPTFQNPSGRTLSEERRRRIVELADQHGLLVLEDDPYGLVRYEGDPLPSLFDLSEGRVAYSSSFSKTIAPGLRVGWFVFPEQLAREIEATATSTYITPVLLGQATVNEFVRRGSFEPNLERVQGAARRSPRRDAQLRSATTSPGSSRRAPPAATSSGSSSAASTRPGCWPGPRRRE